MVTPPTLEALQAVDPNEISEVLFEYYLDVERDGSRSAPFANYGDVERFTRSLPRCLQMVVAYYTYIADVYNGGLKQVFNNHTPAEIMRSLETLRAIGSDQGAGDLEQAISTYTKFGWNRESIERFYDCPTVGSQDDADLEVLSNRISDNDPRDYLLLANYLQENLEQCARDNQ